MLAGKGRGLEEPPGPCVDQVVFAESSNAFVRIEDIR